MPKLWTRTVDAVKRELRRLSRAHGGTPARLRYAKVAEFQARGAVHLHALVRLDGDDPADPTAVLPPPPWATVELLNAAAGRRRPRRPRSAHRRTSTGRTAGWCSGASTSRPLPVRRGLPGAEVTEQHVAGYLAKYATKATEPAGHLSTRLTDSTVRLLRRPGPAHRPAHRRRLGPSADRTPERPGPGSGRGLTCSASAATSPPRAAPTRPPSAHSAPPARPRCAARTPPPPTTRPSSTPDDDEDPVLVVGSWTYAGTGWRTTADAALALAAADAARSRRPATAPAA